MMMMMVMVLVVMIINMIATTTIFLLLAPQNCAFIGCGNFKFDKLGVDRDKSIDKRSDLETETMCNQ